jgi:hypothetical protein
LDAWESVTGRVIVLLMMAVSCYAFITWIGGANWDWPLSVFRGIAQRTSVVEQDILPGLLTLVAAGAVAVLVARTRERAAASRREFLLDKEVHQQGLLVLTIEFDLEQGGWVLGLTSPPLWDLDQFWSNERIYSQVVIPTAEYENEGADSALESLLQIHFERLGLPHGALPIWRPDAW